MIGALKLGSIIENSSLFAKRAKSEWKIVDIWGRSWRWEYAGHIAKNGENSDFERIRG